MLDLLHLVYLFVVLNMSGFVYLKSFSFVMLSIDVSIHVTTSCSELMCDAQNFVGRKLKCLREGELEVTV